jgi:cytochrome c oxidase subunit 1
MTTTLTRPATASGPSPAAPIRASGVERKGNIFVRWITSTDHKVIGNLYLITSFIYFLLGGVMALVIRAQLFAPGLSVVATGEQYNQLFTMHGTIMLLMFATPLFFGFGNAIMPLQIGAPDVAFPRLNMLSYWLFSFGSLIAVSGFLTPQGAASFGWFAYSPLSSTTFSPGYGGNLWVFGLALSGFGTILGGVNFITTIITMRAPGMTMFRMPIFTWNTLVTSLLILMAFPVLAAALFGLGADRVFGAHIYDAANGGAILWQHLFWFFGHPEVYIIALPFFGIVSEVFPVFSRKPIFGYRTLIFATIAIAALSVTVWAHHMYVTGSVLLPFFSFFTMLIAVPTGVKIFNWIGTMWRGSLTFETPMLWAIGFLVTFPLRGVWHRGVRDVLWLLLLVAEVDRQDAQRAARQDSLLAAVRRIPHDIPDPALDWCARTPTPLPHLSGGRRCHVDESALHDRGSNPRDLDAAVLLQRIHHGTKGSHGEHE